MKTRCDSCHPEIENYAELCAACRRVLDSTPPGLESIKNLVALSGCNLIDAQVLLAKVGRHRAADSGRTPPPTLEEIDATLAAVPRTPDAIDVQWDGDDGGWWIVLTAYYIARPELPRRHVHLGVYPYDAKPAVQQLGQVVADRHKIPFYFPSPEHPEDDTPLWFQRESAVPCSICGVPLIQDDDCPWKGQCYACCDES